MRKIIIFSKHFWPENFKINIIAKELVTRGYDVTVLTSSPGYNLNRNKGIKNSFFLKKKHGMELKFIIYQYIKKEIFIGLV